MTIRAIIFDMDGLLVDSEVYWEEARRSYCAAIGCMWRPEDENAVKGHNSAEWAAVIAASCGASDEEETIIAGVTGRMMSLYEAHLPLLPGAVNVVRELGVSFPLAVASSSPAEIISYVTDRAGIYAEFSVIVSADTVGKGKPAPDVFLAAARNLDVKPGECVVFEDSTAGILAGKAGGMFVVAVPNAHYPPTDRALEQADLVLPTLGDFRMEMLDAF